MLHQCLDLIATFGRVVTRRPPPRHRHQAPVLMRIFGATYFSRPSDTILLSTGLCMARTTTRNRRNARYPLKRP
eukprot:29472-Pelagococcus_subviridis.AAC.25